MKTLFEGTTLIGIKGDTRVKYNLQKGSLEINENHKVKNYDVKLENFDHKDVVSVSSFLNKMPDTNVDWNQRKGTLDIDTSTFDDWENRTGSLIFAALAESKKAVLFEGNSAWGWKHIKTGHVGDSNRIPKDKSIFPSAMSDNDIMNRGGRTNLNIHFCIENEELLHQGYFFEFFKGKVDIVCKDNGSDFVLSFYLAVDTLELFFSLLYLMESRGVKVKLDNPTSIVTYHFELKDDQFVVDYFIGEDLEANYEAPVPYQSFKNGLETSLHAYLEGLKKINPDLVNDPIYQGLARCQINRKWFSNYCEMIADSFRRANREVPVGDEFFQYHIVKR